MRNLGVMVAAAGGRVPELTWLYIAMAQFPIYLLPHLLKPLLAAIQGMISPNGVPMGRCYTLIATDWPTVDVGEHLRLVLDHALEEVVERAAGRVPRAALAGGRSSSVTCEPSA